VDGSQSEVEVRAGPAGLYGVDLLVTGSTPDGTLVERSVFLAFEVQPDTGRGLPAAGWIGAPLA